MSRKKEFNPEKALERAMDLFWLQGYKATSVQNLCDIMGIKKGSLYDTFGSKRSLYLATLERYRRLNNFPSRTLEESGSAKAVIVAMFNELVDLSAADEKCRGCFVVNTIVELAAKDPTFSQFGEAVRQEYEAIFYDLLAAAAEAGEIAPNQNIIALARTLTSAIFGLRVTAKTTRERTVLQDIACTTLAILD